MTSSVKLRGSKSRILTGLAFAAFGFFVLGSARSLPSPTTTTLGNSPISEVVGRDLVIGGFVVSNSSEPIDESSFSSSTSHVPSGNGDRISKRKDFTVYVLDSNGGRFEKHNLSSPSSAVNKAADFQPNSGRELPGSPGTLRTSGKDSRAVFGVDDRTQPDTSVNPYTKIGRLTFTNNGIIQICTASLVHANLIITNAHCVTNDSFQVPENFLDNVDFSLGLMNGVAIEKSNIDKVWVAENYINEQGCPQSCSFADDDWAILRLTEPLGETYGWFGVLEFSPSAVDSCSACNGGMELAGYSADQACDNGKTLCTHKMCSIVTKITFNKLNLEGVENHFVSYAVHDCDSQGGSSGSAVFNFVTEQIYALHAQSATDGTPNPTFSSSPTKNSPFPGNLAIPSDVWFSELQTIISQEQSEGGSIVSTCTTVNPGEAGFCSSDCKCNQGEGDCGGDDSVCQGVLVCVMDIGGFFGFSNSTDICVSPCSGLNPNPSSACDFPSTEDLDEEDDDESNFFDFNPFDASGPFAEISTTKILLLTGLVLALSSMLWQ